MKETNTKLTMKERLFCHQYINKRVLKDAVMEVYGEQPNNRAYYHIGNKILKKDHVRAYVQLLLDNQHIEGQIERALIIAELKNILYTAEAIDTPTKFAALDRLMKMAGVSEEAQTLGLNGTIRIIQD